MTLITAVAFHPDKKIACAYNEIMCLANEDDWVCFIDHDAVWTTYDWYTQIQSIISKYPDGGLFVAMTNRIGLPIQVPFPTLSKQRLKEYGGPVYTVSGNSHDMRFHRKMGHTMADKHKIDVLDLTDKISNGVVQVTSKRVWKEAGGFNESRDALGGVDTDYHRAVKRIGKKIYLMRGIYVYHWYRETSTFV
jgi:GT2 family glycosyltransferase